MAYGFALIVPGFEAATHARFRIDQALRSLAWVFAVSLGAVALAAYGY